MTGKVLFVNLLPFLEKNTSLFCKVRGRGLVRVAGCGEGPGKGAKHMGTVRACAHCNARQWHNPAWRWHVQSSSSFQPVPSRQAPRDGRPATLPARLLLL